MKKIKLTKGKVALVDDELFEGLSKFSWSVDGSGYAQRNRKTTLGWRPIRMHRDILGLVGKQAADHINGNKLDNRRKNLRLATPKENIRNRGTNRNNTTGYKGVYFNSKRRSFQAFITVDFKHIFLGAYATAEEAARAYDAAARKYFGEFARLNFPDV